VFGTELGADRLTVQTSDLRALTHALPRIAQANGVTLFEAGPTDDSLESVFSYLVQR
jgi:ABC-2 type transport system ATP-binding protein